MVYACAPIYTYSLSSSRVTIAFQCHPDYEDDQKPEHQTDTACSWLVCHSRGDCSGEHCANCIHLPRLSGGPASQFFGEASRAFPQHGWRSAYSLRETLSPTQDQGQHSRPLHTHTPNHPHSPSSLTL